MLLALAAVAFADSVPCAGTTTLADFSAAAQKGEAAFADMDMGGLVTAREAAATALTCLGEPVKPDAAASFHRLMAMVAFTVHDNKEALAEFHAARRLQPGYAIPDSVAPAGHPLTKLYEESVSAEEGALQPVGNKVGTLYVDGIRGAPRPDGISAILQHFDEIGMRAESVYLLAGDPIPAWAVPPSPSLKGKMRVPLASATGVAAIASGVLYGLALSAHDQFWDTENPAKDSELPTLQARANTLTYASAGVGALAVGLGTVTIVTW